MEDELCWNVLRRPRETHPDLLETLAVGLTYHCFGTVRRRARSSHS